MIAFTAPLKVWSNDEGRMHFMMVPTELAVEIKAHAMAAPRGFGSVKVEVSIGDVVWRTSIFPSRSSGSYFLPIKIDSCRKAGIAEGDAVSVQLELL